MRYRLRTLLILLAIGPPALAWISLHTVELAAIAFCFAFVWLIATLSFHLAVRLERPAE